MPSFVNWSDHAFSHFDALDPERTIAVLPTAAIEQHGPHLPLGTDTEINAGLLATAEPLLPSDLNVLVLPLQAVGKSNEHIWAPGTLSLSAQTALALWTEIGLSVARAGVKKIVIVNSHGGNLDVISILARALRVQAGMLAVKCQWGSFGYPDGLFSDQEMAYGLHGGDIETSLMLHFRPELVDMAHAQDFRSTAEDALIPPVGPISYGWIASDLNPHGVVGEAHMATAEKGRLTAAYQARGFVQLLKTVAETPLPGDQPS